MLKSLHRFKLRMVKKMTFLPSKIYIPNLYEYFTGKKLDLKNPKEFNAKLQWYKVFYRPIILNQLVDKFAVRSYVEEKIGKEYLNECYQVCNSPEEINFENLPKSFIIKATHTSSYNLIIKDKATLKIPQIKKRLHKWLQKNQYYRTGQEWAYKDVQPRIIFEKLLTEEKQNSLTDYKFYCFNGKAAFMEVHLDREHNHKRAFYDFDFKKLPFSNVSEKKKIDKEIENPGTISQMQFLAEKLAGNFPFVRVDFYSIAGKITFGEMTFYPSDGRKDFYPESYNLSVGDLFELPKIPLGKKEIKEI